jgi:hypothetical protein
VRFDSEGSKRASVDINQILIPQKLAVRFAALSADQRTPRELQYQRRNSLYLNLTMQPFKARRSTSMRKRVASMNRSPGSYLAYDSVSAWLSSPLTPFEKANRIDNLIVASGSTTARNAARNLITGVTQGVSNTSNYLVYIMNAPQLGVLNWKWKSKGSEAYVNGQPRIRPASPRPPSCRGSTSRWKPWCPDRRSITTPPGTKYSASWQQQLLAKTFLEVAGAYETSSTRIGSRSPAATTRSSSTPTTIFPPSWRRATRTPPSR